jgi:hypothetical protein
VHAGVLIYYLGYARYNDILLPGEHLNAVLVDLEKNESPNKPRYVTHKRRKLFTEKSVHHHPDEWTEIQLKNYISINSERLINWFQENYVSERRTAISLDDNNISQHYFTFEQQIIIGLALDQLMQQKVNTRENRIKRFITTHMFQKVMTDIVLTSYNCSSNDIKLYIDFINIEITRLFASSGDNYLETIKKLKLIRLNDWLGQKVTKVKKRLILIDHI